MTATQLLFLKHPMYFTKKALKILFLDTPVISTVAAYGILNRSWVFLIVIIFKVFLGRICVNGIFYLEMIHKFVR